MKGYHYEINDLYDFDRSEEKKRKKKKKSARPSRWDLRLSM